MTRLCSPPIHSVTGSLVFGWVLDHAGPNGVELDVAVAAQHVALFLCQTRAEPSFPERAAAFVTRLRLKAPQKKTFDHRLPVSKSMANEINLAPFWSVTYYSPIIPIIIAGAALIPVGDHEPVFERTVVKTE